MPRPPGTSCSHTHANETPSRYRCHLHACRRAMSCWPRCLRRSTLTCRAAARPALVRSWCGINCLDVQLSRAARPTTTRETDRVGPPKLCPQTVSLRSMIGHRCATVAFVALALARMPLQTQAGPSMSAASSSRARSGILVCFADSTCRSVCRMWVEERPPYHRHPLIRRAVTRL
jgi:hypothetical protein